MTDKHKMCTRKLRMPTESVAETVAYLRLWSDYKTYRCPLCGGFHFASPSKRRELRRKKRMAKQ